MKSSKHFFAAAFCAVSCGHEENSDPSSQHMIQVCIRYGGGVEACKRKYGSPAPHRSTEPARNGVAAALPIEGEDHRAKFSLYTIENTAMEGGPLDRCGRRLNTLEDYLAGRAASVSLAMDSLAFPYGTLVRIPELEVRLNDGRPIEFRVVDTGGAFRRKGTSRIDLCVGNSQADIYGRRFGWISQASFAYKVVQRGKGKPGACP